MITVLIVITAAVHGLLIGMMIGQHQERKWERQKLKMNQDLEDCQREVNEILAAQSQSQHEPQEFSSNHIH